jgi:lysophospholipase L1-like esterase
MRAHRAQVVPLDHDLDLPGRFPPRWLVVLGDSAAAGYDLPDAEMAIARRVGRGLQAVDGRATAVRSVAVDGARTGDVLSYQVDAADGAEVVLLGVGVNDALRPGVATAEVAALTDQLLATVRDRAAEGAHIVFLTCPDLSAAPGLPRVLTPVVGARCRALARAQTEVAARHGVATIAASKPLLAPEVFGRDGFHPGPVGHALLAEQTLELLTGPRSSDRPSDRPSDPFSVPGVTPRSGRTPARRSE